MLALGAIREALIELPAASRPVPADAIWPTSPSAETEQAMAAIGTAAARGDGVPPAAQAMLHHAAHNAPLAPEPFVVDGTIALSQGKDEALPLFEAARLRDPRASAARYFLAELYLAKGRVEEALTEMSALATLVPSAVAQLAPSVAAFARTPGAVPALQATFRKSPTLESATLNALATDPANADIVLALAGPVQRSAAAAPWQANMIATLIAAGQTAKARAVWRALSGVKDEGLVFRPDFRSSPAPGPFNWTLASGPAGIVQARAGGGLDVVYYGREDAVLASQTLLLGPGTYLLAARSDPVENAGSLGWTLRCVPAGEMLGRVALADTTPEVSGRIEIPPGCVAQALELRGSVSDLDAPVELTVYSVRIVPGGEQ